ncbi:hypothetical protein [Actinomadura sp. KC216]|nr:hypothetical protein [Actinomadura sp. KC216]
MRLNPQAVGEEEHAIDRSSVLQAAVEAGENGEQPVLTHASVLG